MCYIVSIVDGVVVLGDLGLVHQTMELFLFFIPEMPNKPGELILTNATKYALSRV